MTIRVLGQNETQFVPFGAFWGEHGLPLSASGKAVNIDGDYWPVSQLRLGAETVYGRELCAPKWLLEKKRQSDNAQSAQNTASMAYAANSSKTSL